MIMKKSLLIALLLLLPVFALATPSSSSAQQPKMDIKLFFGFSGTTFISQLETGRVKDTFLGMGNRLRSTHSATKCVCRNSVLVQSLGVRVPGRCR